MKSIVCRYYTRSNTQRETTSAMKSEKSHIEETPSRAVYEEDRQKWMIEAPNEGASGEKDDVPRGRSTLARRKSFTLVHDSTPKRKFNELILTIHSITGAITNMQR